MAFIKQKTQQIINEDERAAPRDFDGLCLELNHDDPQVRRWAVRDLSTYAEANSVLATRLKIENNGSVRTAILDTLAKFADDISMAALVDCLRSNDAALRNEAIDVLKSEPEHVAQIIDSLLNDEDSDVRIFAVNILESLRHQNVEKWLINVIENDEHLNVCAAAVDLLSEVGTENALNALENLKARFADEPYICFSVDLALQRIRQGDH